jgi:hypothetical protein
MDLNFWFSMSGAAAMLGWLLLILYPKRQRGLLTLTGLIIPAGLGLAYAVFIIPNFRSVEGAGYNSLAEVKALFSNDKLLLAGWIHYLAFDLAVGTYTAKESDRIGLSRVVQIPLLLLTFLFGPIGLLSFVVLKWGQSISEKLAPVLAKKIGAVK